MLVPNRRDAFLASTPIIDADHRQVAAQAKRLSLGQSDLAAVRRIYQWVRDAVPHTGDLGEGPITCTASEVLEHGTGICYAKSHLLAALLRSIGVPAGLVYQRLTKDPPHEGFELHGLNSVWIESWRRWVLCDARGNREATNDLPPVDAELTPTGDRLAFEIDPEKGEKTDPRVFADPLPSVIDALTEYETFEELWPNLPSELPDAAAMFR